MKAQLRTLSNDQLTRLELSLEEYLAAKVEDHELKINGKMYDIAREELIGGKIMVDALQDEAEDSLFSFLDEITKRTTHDKARASTSLIQFTTLHFLIPNFSNLTSSVSECMHTTTGYQFSISSYCRAIESPPPRPALTL